MNHSIKLGFVGHYQDDIIQYLSRILACLGYLVAIIDASEEQNFRYAIPNVVEDDLVSYYGIDCFLNRNTPKKLSVLDLQDYDIILINYGFNAEMAVDFDSLSLLFLITNFEIHHVMRLKRLIENLELQEIKVVKIFRDLVSSKITVKYINRLLSIDGAVSVLEEYCISLQEADIAARLVCQHDDHFQFKGLSRSYKTMFVDIISEVMDEDPKRIGKAMKIAAEGKLKKCK